MYKPGFSTAWLDDAAHHDGRNVVRPSGLVGRFDQAPGCVPYVALTDEWHELLERDDVAQAIAADEDVVALVELDFADVDVAFLFAVPEAPADAAAVRMVGGLSGREEALLDELLNIVWSTVICSLAPSARIR